MYYYDWKLVGVKAPSVLPEVERDQVEFALTEMASIPAVESPAVLAPYNVTQSFDTVLRGKVNGKSTEIFTDKKLVVAIADVKPGTVLVLEVGKKNPQHVFSIKRK